MGVCLQPITATQHHKCLAQLFSLIIQQQQLSKHKEDRKGSSNAIRPPPYLYATENPEEGQGEGSRQLGFKRQRSYLPEGFKLPSMQGFHIVVAAAAAAAAAANTAPNDRGDAEEPLAASRKKATKRGRPAGKSATEAGSAPKRQKRVSTKSSAAVRRSGTCRLAGATSHSHGFARHVQSSAMEIDSDEQDDGDSDSEHELSSSPRRRAIALDEVQRRNPGRSARGKPIMEVDEDEGEDEDEDEDADHQQDDER